MKAIVLSKNEAQLVESIYKALPDIIGPAQKKYTNPTLKNVREFFSQSLDEHIVKGKVVNAKSFDGASDVDFSRNYQTDTNGYQTYGWLCPYDKNSGAINVGKVDYKVALGLDTSEHAIHLTVPYKDAKRGRHIKLVGSIGNKKTNYLLESEEYPDLFLAVRALLYKTDQFNRVALAGIYNSATKEIKRQYDQKKEQSDRRNAEIEAKREEIAKLQEKYSGLIKEYERQDADKRLHTFMYGASRQM